MSTLNDIIDFVRSGTKPFREWEEGVARRATSQGFGDALVDNLSADPATGDFGVVGIGAIHGQNSKLFPKSWRGKDGRFKQLQKEGYSQDEIASIAKEETGFQIWEQPLYRNGEYVRSDLKMNVPDINLKEGPIKVDDVGNVDPRQTYPATQFRENYSMQAGYPDAYNAGAVNLQDDMSMLGQPMTNKLGKYTDEGKVGYTVNQSADWIPETEDSLLPRFAAEDQGIIQDVERFAPGGKRWNPDFDNLAGNVEQRAVAQEFDTILDLRAKGYNNLEIIDELSKQPIYKTLDTPNIMQQTVPRKPGAPRGVVTIPQRVKPKYKQQIEEEYVPMSDEMMDHIEDTIKKEAEKIREPDLSWPDETPGGYTQEELMRMLSARLEQIASYT